MEASIEVVDILPGKKYERNNIVRLFVAMLHEILTTEVILQPYKLLPGPGGGRIGILL